MRTTRVGILGSFKGEALGAGLVGVAAMVAGCSADVGPRSTGRSSERSGPICPECEVAGGQTSDFGSNNGCLEHALLTPLDLDTVDALGVRSAIDSLSGEFESSFRWTPLETASGAPATGYDAVTRVHGRTSILGLERADRAPGFLDCPEFMVKATLELELSTTDGALSVAGQAVAYALPGGAPPWGFASLDLRDATGTLGLHPAAWSEPLSGWLGVDLYFWPTAVRGSIAVELMDTASSFPPPADVDTRPPPRFLYWPLDGKFPDDACEADFWPYAPDEAGALPNGGTALDMRAALQAKIGTDPLPGSWDEGQAFVDVTTTIGMPSNVCARQGILAYEAPLSVTSTDGSISVNQLANGSTLYDTAGNFESAWVEYYDSEAHPPSALAVETGLTGVQLGDASAFLWHTELTFSPNEPVAGGAIVVEEVDAHGVKSGVDGALLGPIATFEWSKRER